jgi:hypothetical protein
MSLSIGAEILSWKVIEYGKWGKNNSVTYILMEHSCGNRRKFQPWEVTNKKFKKCKKCEARVEYRKSAKDIIYRDMYRHYKDSARKRKYSFNLNYDDFITLITGDCRYCGRKPFNKREVTDARKSIWHDGEYVLVNGVDRINSKLGYTLKNCVPCCKTCNFAKSDMTISEWKKLVPLWAERLKKL